MAAKPRNSKWRLLRWRPTLIGLRSSQRSPGHESLVTFIFKSLWKKGKEYGWTVELVVFKEPARFLVFLSRVQVPGRVTYPILGKRKIIVKVPLGVDRKVSRRVNLDLWGTYFQIQQITIGGEKGQATYCFPLWQRFFLASETWDLYPIYIPCFTPEKYTLET